VRAFVLRKKSERNKEIKKRERNLNKKDGLVRTVKRRRRWLQAFHEMQLFSSS
jgi:hypothetical protein